MFRCKICNYPCTRIPIKDSKTKEIIDWEYDYCDCKKDIED